jgi:DNA-binding transcriptional MocR family regulator
VVVTPGHLFYQEKSEKAAFRISIAHCKILEIEEGIKQISQVIKSLKEN